MTFPRSGDTRENSRRVGRAKAMLLAGNLKDLFQRVMEGTVPDAEIEGQTDRLLHQLRQAHGEFEVFGGPRKLRPRGVRLSPRHPSKKA